MIDVIRFDVKTNGCYAVDTIPWSKHFGHRGTHSGPEIKPSLCGILRDQKDLQLADRVRLIERQVRFLFRKRAPLPILPPRLGAFKTTDLTLAEHTGAS